MFFSVSTFFLFSFSFFANLFESLGKQQLRGIRLNICVSNLINFTKLSSNISNIRQYTENLSKWSHIAVRVMWRRDVGQCQINAVYFSVDIISVRQRRNNAVIFNVEFHCVDQCRNNVVNSTIFKKLKRAKYIFELQKKKDGSFN